MFRPAQDIRYHQFLRNLHKRNAFDWYLEIGSRTRKSVAPVRGNAIAIDPYFRIDRDVIGTKRMAYFFQMTSDAFFESRFLERNEISISFSFLDGMHLFEFLLRDFINTERNTAPGGAIALHDCCPYSTEMTTRDHADIGGMNWTGDVWKIIPILQKYRPDLKLEVIGCRPTGLVIVSNVARSNTVLSDNYDDIVAEFADIDFSGRVVEEFYASFEYTPAAEFLRRSKATYAEVCLSDNEVVNPEFVSP